MEGGNEILISLNKSKADKDQMGETSSWKEMGLQFFQW